MASAWASGGRVYNCGLQKELNGQIKCEGSWKTVKLTLNTQRIVLIGRVSYIRI